MPFICFSEGIQPFASLGFGAIAGFL